MSSSLFSRDRISVQHCSLLACIIFNWSMMALIASPTPPAETCLPSPSETVMVTRRFMKRANGEVSGTFGLHLPREMASSWAARVPYFTRNVLTLSARRWPKASL